MLIIQNEFIRKLYDSLLVEYEKSENSLRGGNFVFSSVDLIYLQFVKINPKRVGTYVETPEWISKKKAIINPKTFNVNFRFEYSVIASTHYDETRRDHCRISKLKPYINR